MAKQLTDLQKSEISVLYFEGVTQKELARRYDVMQSTISRILKRKRNNDSVSRIKGSGRPAKLERSETNLINGILKIDPKIGSKKIANIISQKKKIPISSRTIHRKLVNMGFLARIACSKPLLSKKSIDIRFSFSKIWLPLDKTYWDGIIFSDETKINLFGSDGRIYVRRKDGTRFQIDHLKPTVKFGGGCIMVWGCFSSKGVGRLVIIDGNMDALKYIKILDTNLIESARIMGLNSFIFQQDNDPKHKSKLATEYFNDKKIKVMDWPSQSPDMNPIEHLWAHLKIKINQRNPKNLKELKMIMIEEWNLITPAFCVNLIKSMPKRVLDLYIAKGGHTSY